MLLFVSIQTVNAQSLQDFFEASNEFFKTYVNDGRVNYKEIKKNPEVLNELVELSKGIAVTKDDESNYQAFWINGYNIQVIKGIVDNYPVQSPLDISGFFDKTKRVIGHKEITLNDIENKLLRGNFPSEARFHFVLVCAGLGCPPIIDRAYTPEKLEHQLQDQAEIALNNPDFVRVKGKKVQLSQIFEWYKDDFTQNGKSLLDYVNQFRKEKIDSKSKVGHYEYNWALNDSK